MNLSSLCTMLRQLAEKQEKPWEVDQRSIVVRMSLSERRQRIRYSIDGEHIVLSTVVLKAAAYKHELELWNRVTIRCWMRNAESNLITFSFDEDDNLIAIVRHLAGHLDPNELLLYVQTLAAESDRFEYVLSGADLH